MAKVSKWLESVPSYAPTSPPFAPIADPLLTADGKHFADIPTDRISLLDIDSEGNMYFDVPYTLPQDVPPQQSWIVNKSIPIDASHTMMDPPMPPESSSSVPDHLTEINTKILIYLARVLKVPKDLENESTTKWTFTAEELEALEPISENNYEPPTLSTIDGICVQSDPQLANIQSVLDDKRVGSDRRTFYLAKDLNGGYFWFHPPRAERDLRLNELIGDYRHRSRVEVTGKETRGIKKVRRGRKNRI